MNQLINKQLQDAFNRESVKLKCRQTLPAFIGVNLTFIALVLILRFEVPSKWLLLWSISVFVALLGRFLISRNVLKRFDQLSSDEISLWNYRLRLSSLFNQSIVGSGIWIVGYFGQETSTFLITLLIGLYGIGAMINLGTDYRTFSLSIPLLIGQPILYWLSTSLHGVGIAMTLSVLMLLMLGAARNSHQTFQDSIIMRFEKNELLEQVQDERAKVETALAEAKTANQSKAFFMAAASHDLRQPLYAISLLNETLALQKLSSSAKDILDKQHHAIRVLCDLFDDLLDLSKFDAGHIKANIRVVALNELLLPINNEFSPMCNAKNIQWKFSVPDNLYIKSDPELLSRLIRNILSNALRYTEQGHISLSVFPSNNEILCEIEDTGLGIPESDQRRIFGQYVQLNNKPSREKGAGLGLAIVKHIDEVLNLNLEMRSHTNTGTYFSFRIPFSEKPNNLVQYNPESKPKTINLDGISVWLIEDDKLVRTALALQLEKWNCRVHFFQNKTDLLQYQKQHQTWPDAIILDDMLDTKDSGLEIAQHLAALGLEERILIVTANSDPGRHSIIDKAGFTQLKKPIMAKDLGNWLQQFTNNHERLLE